MSAKRTGTIHKYEPAKPGEKHGHYVVRVTAPDGTRPIFHLEPSPRSAQAEARAKETAGHISEKIHAEGLGAVPRHSASRQPESAQGIASEWWTEYDKFRRAAGLGRPVDGLYEKHIRPVVGKPWPEVTQEDCELLRNALDAKAQADEISAKTAFNVWTIWTTAAKAASGQWKKDKPKKLRVRTDNPCVTSGLPVIQIHRIHR